MVKLRDRFVLLNLCLHFVYSAIRGLSPSRWRTTRRENSLKYRRSYFFRSPRDELINEII